MDELQIKLDEAAKELSKCGEVKFSEWAAYFLEAIESVYGKEGLTCIANIIEERHRVGGW